MHGKASKSLIQLAFLLVAEGVGAGDEAMRDGNGTNSTARSDSVGDEGSQLSESSRLKARVVVLTSMNRTLREELSVYDTLCRSMGVQVECLLQSVRPSGKSYLCWDGSYKIGGKIENIAYM